MLKQLFMFTCLTLSIGANAAIVSLDSTFGIGTITRDTSTGMNWLDINLTHGLSYNQVSSQLGSGGAYEGYRYATAREFDQLVVNFGYIPLTNNCPDGFANCDLYQSSGSIRNPMFATMVETLGGGESASGFYGIGVVGLTESAVAGGGGYQVGMSVLEEALTDYFITDPYNGQIIEAGQQWEYSAARLSVPGDISGTALPYLGSFLVAPSAVPLPAAGWLFLSALIGLAGKKRLSRKA